MAEASILQQGIDRVQEAFDSLEKEYKRLPKQADKRRLVPRRSLPLLAGP